MVTRGIDVSLYQGNIDWKKVKNSGIDFAVIKASQGDISGGHFKDPRFEYNIDAAHEAGLKLGVYHYYKGNETETDYFLSVIKPHSAKIALYAALDVEDTASLENYSIAQLTEKVKNSFERIKTAGFSPCLYANTNWLKNKLNPSGLTIWEANWGKYKPERDGLVMWQYSSSGNVDGINGNVDLNYGYFPFAGNGDVNKDGYVNTSDVIELIKYNAGWNNTNVDLFEADINGDGKVNTSDVIELMKKVSSNNKIIIKPGDRVKVKNPIDYDTGKPFVLWHDVYTVMQVNGDRAVIGSGGVITSAVNVSDLTLA